MERERITQGNGHARGEGTPGPLGDVARDAIDHTSMLVRDELKIARLEARRYVEHVRRDLAPRALGYTGAAILGGLSVVFGLIALFLGIASAIGVAWAFVVYFAVFAGLSALAVALGIKQPGARDEAEEIARRFPAARVTPNRPEHALVAQQTSPAGHQRALEEARREGETRGPLTSA